MFLRFYPHRNIQQHPATESKRNKHSRTSPEKQRTSTQSRITKNHQPIHPPKPTQRSRRGRKATSADVNLIRVSCPGPGGIHGLRECHQILGRRPAKGDSSLVLRVKINFESVLADGPTPQHPPSGLKPYLINSAVLRSLDRNLDTGTATYSQLAKS
ncbi:hypothetical protein BO82DRAFT_131760 [Aspergillus uvarum CBS 121591]|uniref:Uncharacterized protein n=1 Tax=Aspergillus uvarum CBS 121591 TaxID=1448315 RepID=A0A319C6X0_9EURO|nr:hypothetical protein BO82DRAFT_131760 [Aspergillus uvarum CBS 121591]PYH79579.1 hypothetical protein BO82DRAFT_131760 [Aspergillus uvarum CBS 121591]